MRYMGSGEADATTGRWLVPQQGLLIYSDQSNCWQVEPTIWLTTHRVVPDAEGHWYVQRRRWLIRHGLDRAQLPTRRAVAQAVEYALQRDPLPQVVGACG